MRARHRLATALALLALLPLLPPGAARLAADWAFWHDDPWLGVVPHWRWDEMSRESLAAGDARPVALQAAAGPGLRRGGGRR